MQNVPAQDTTESQAEYDSVRELNTIDLIPTQILANKAANWQHKDLSGVQLGSIGAIEKTMDWSFSSAYKGTIGSLRAALTQIPAEFSLPEDLEATLAATIPEERKFTAQVRRQGSFQQELPVHLLGQDNPIKHYGQVVLYEDEFADRGYSKSYVRFRVMKDCFFVLQRSYIRIDHVTVRILDTRLFHQFSENQIIRDFCHRESTYDELRLAGFTFGSDWLLSEAQSDQVYPFLIERSSFKDTILLTLAEE